jgi:sortase A
MLKRNKVLLCILILGLICGLTFLLLKKIFINKETSDQKIIELLDTNNDAIDDNEKKEKKSVSQKKNYNYISVLEIPSIGLKKGLVDKNSKYNNVKYNIQIIKNSTMPDKEKGNFVLAGHNGNSSVSFFKNLDKLSIHDVIYVYYKDYKYTYILNKIYETQKDGQIEIYRDYDKTTITLITCKTNTKDKQVVYIGYLKDKQLY